MAIKHAASKVTGDRGYAAEWNADHVITSNVDFNLHQMLQAVVENRTTWPAGPVEGQIIYRSDENTFYIWNGTSWVGMVGPATIVVAADGSGQYTDVQDGIDALPAGGGVVYIKEGTYTIDAPILITKSNVALMGAGAATILIAKVNLNDKVIIIGDAANTYSGIIIESIYVDGNKANQVAGDDGIWLRTKVEDSRIIGCWIADCTREGLDIDSGSARNHILSNVFKDCDLNGIDIDLSNAGTVIQGNFCKDNGDSGIYGAGSGGYTVIAENVCVTNGEDGIEIRGGLTLIEGNACSSNSENGIFIFSDHISVVANICRYNNFHGIWLFACDYNLVSGNYVYNSSFNNDNTYSEIHLSNTSTYNIISSNQCHADDLNFQAKYGIRENAAADDWNLIHGNIVIGQQTARISTQGPNTVTADNIAP